MFGMGTGVSLAPWAPTTLKDNLRFSFNAAFGINPNLLKQTAATTFPLLRKVAEVDANELLMHEYDVNVTSFDAK